MKLFISLFLSIALTFTSIPVQAGVYTPMPAPGTLVAPSAAVQPNLLRGLVLDFQDPFHFQFVVDDRQGHKLNNADHERLVQYFFAALTVPDKDKWVNLSPYEKDRIVPDSLAQTQLGRDLLAQDYLLKQISSSLTHPDTPLGKTFWNALYEKSYQTTGSTDVPDNLFHKVWITPGQATVYQSDKGAYVVESYLKVMLEEDYKQVTGHRSPVTEVMREVVIPAIEKEVNEGAHFATIRQIYHALILAQWYKDTLKNQITQSYINQNKIDGVDVYSLDEREAIYQKYLESVKKGAYNFIKEELDHYAQETIPRKYFSGGTNAVIQSTDYAMTTDVSLLPLHPSFVLDIRADDRDPQTVIFSFDAIRNRFRRHLPTHPSRVVVYPDTRLLEADAQRQYGLSPIGPAEEELKSIIIDNILSGNAVANIRRKTGTTWMYIFKNPIAIPGVEGHLSQITVSTKGESYAQTFSNPQQLLLENRSMAKGTSEQKRDRLRQLFSLNITVPQFMGISTRDDVQVFNAAVGLPPSSSIRSENRFFNRPEPGEEMVIAKPADSIKFQKRKAPKKRTKRKVPNKVEATTALATVETETKSSGWQMPVGVALVVVAVGLFVSWQAGFFAPTPIPASESEKAPPKPFVYSAKNFVHRGANMPSAMPTVVTSAPVRVVQVKDAFNQAVPFFEGMQKYQQDGGLDPNLANNIERGLLSTNPAVRAYACNALAMIYREGAFDSVLLKVAREDTNDYVRVSAIHALRNYFNNSEVIEALEDIAENNTSISAMVKQYIKEVIDQHRGYYSQDRIYHLSDQMLPRYYEGGSWIQFTNLNGAIPTRENSTVTVNGQAAVNPRVPINFFDDPRTVPSLLNALTFPQETLGLTQQGQKIPDHMLRQFQHRLQWHINRMGPQANYELMRVILSAATPITVREMAVNQLKMRNRRYSQEQKDGFYMSFLGGVDHLSRKGYGTIFQDPNITLASFVVASGTSVGARHNPFGPYNLLVDGMEGFMPAHASGRASVIATLGVIRDAEAMSLLIKMADPSSGLHGEAAFSESMRIAARGNVVRFKDSNNRPPWQNLNDYYDNGEDTWKLDMRKRINNQGQTTLALAAGPIALPLLRTVINGDLNPIIVLPNGELRPARVDSGFRLSLIYDVINMPGQQAMDYTVGMMLDEDQDIREAAANGLGYALEIGKRTVAEVEASYRHAVARGISKEKLQGSLTLIQEGCESCPAAVKQGLAGINNAINQGNPDPVTPLFADPFVGIMNTFVTTGEISDRDLLYITEGIYNPHEHIRVASARAMTYLYPKGDYSSMLIEMFHWQKRGVVPGKYSAFLAECIHAVASYPNGNVVKFLQDVLNDEKLSLYHKSARRTFRNVNLALRRNRTIGNNAQELVRDYYDSLQWLNYRGLAGKVHYSEAKRTADHVLLQHFSSSDAFSSPFSMRLLEHPGMVEPLVRAMANPDAYIPTTEPLSHDMKQAFHAGLERRILYMQANPEVLPELFRLVNDENQNVRQQSFQLINEVITLQGGVARRHIEALDVALKELGGAKKAYQFSEGIALVQWIILNAPDSVLNNNFIIQPNVGFFLQHVAVNESYDLSTRLSAIKTLSHRKHFSSYYLLAATVNYFGLTASQEDNQKISQAAAQALGSVKDVDGKAVWEKIYEDWKRLKAHEAGDGTTGVAYHTYQSPEAARMLFSAAMSSSNPLALLRAYHRTVLDEDRPPIDASENNNFVPYAIGFLIRMNTLESYRYLLELHAFHANSKDFDAAFNGVFSGDELNEELFVEAFLRSLKQASGSQRSILQTETVLLIGEAKKVLKKKSDQERATRLFRKVTRASLDDNAILGDSPELTPGGIDVREINYDQVQNSSDFQIDSAMVAEPVLTPLTGLRPTIIGVRSVTDLVALYR